jgi:hypothetical protein
MDGGSANQNASITKTLLTYPQRESNPGHQHSSAEAQHTSYNVREFWLIVYKCYDDDLIRKAEMCGT